MSWASFMSDGAEYLQPGIEKAGAVRIKDILNYLGGKPTMGSVMKETGQTLNAITFGQAPKTVGRMAGSKLGRAFARSVPALSAVGNVMDVADIIAGDDGLDNKLVDATAMGIGGTAGFMLGGPLGASVGASAGKMITDGIQGWMAPKKPEADKLEAALALLESGVI